MHTNIAMYVLLSIVSGLAGLARGTIFGTNMLTLDTRSVDECPWSEPIHDHVQRMISLRYNYVRVPVASEYVTRGEWGQLDNLVTMTKETGAIDVALELLDDTCGDTVGEGGDTESCLYNWDVLLLRFHGFSNVKMVCVLGYSDADTPRRIVAHVESLYPERFAYVVDHELLAADIAQSRVHYVVRGESVVSGDALQGDKNDKVMFPMGFSEMIDFSCSHNITDSFIGTYAGTSSGGILADGCIAVHDWEVVDLQQQFWSIVNSLLRGARQVTAPGSPDSVTGRGFATNTLLIY